MHYVPCKVDEVFTRPGEILAAQKYNQNVNQLSTQGNYVNDVLDDLINRGEFYKPFGMELKFAEIERWLLKLGYDIEEIKKLLNDLDIPEIPDYPEPQEISGLVWVGHDNPVGDAYVLWVDPDVTSVTSSCGCTVFVQQTRGSSNTFTCNIEMNPVNTAISTAEQTVDDENNMVQWLPESITANPEDVLIGILLENETNGLSVPIANGGIGNLLVSLDSSNTFDNYYITNFGSTLGYNPNDFRKFECTIEATGDTYTIYFLFNNIEETQVIGG